MKRVKMIPVTRAAQILSDNMERIYAENYARWKREVIIAINRAIRRAYNERITVELPEWVYMNNQWLHAICMEAGYKSEIDGIESGHPGSRIVLNFVRKKKSK